MSSTLVFSSFLTSHELQEIREPTNFSLNQSGGGGCVSQQLSPLLRHKHFALFSPYKQHSFSTPTPKTTSQHRQQCKLSLSRVTHEPFAHAGLHCSLNNLRNSLMCLVAFLRSELTGSLQLQATVPVREIHFVSPLSEKLHFSPRTFWLP